MTSVIPISLVSLERESFHISIPAVVTGRNVHLLIDTGASRTVFDQGRFLDGNPGSRSMELEEEVFSTGIGTDSVDVSFVKLKDLSIGGYHRKNYMAVLIDLSHINTAFVRMGLEPIDGILGGDLLVKLRSVIDYRRKTLTISFRKSR